MIRFAIFACLVSFMLAVSANATDTPRYAVTAQANRSGDQFSISIKIVENKMEVVPNVGNTMTTITLSSPRLKFTMGQRGQISVGTPHSEAKGAKPTTQPDQLESGITVDVICAKGEDHVVMVTTIVESGAIVWADAANVHIETTAEGAK
jgi:hypothetical protein